MRRLVIFLLALSLTAGRAAAEAGAPTVIAEAMDAMGGQGHLAGLHSLKLDLRTVLYRIDNSEEEDGAPWLNIDVGAEWRDEDAARYRAEADDASAQWVVPHSVKLDDGRALATGVLWKGAWRWSASPSLGERLALSAERVLFTAAAARDLHREPDGAINGEPQEVVAFSWKGFPTRLYIDKALHLPTRIEQTRASPLERSSVMLGDVNWRTDFLFYKPEPSGLVYPRHWALYRDGRAYITTVVLKLSENAPPPAAGYAPPAEAHLDLPSAALAAYGDQPIPAPKSGDTLKPLGPDVWEIAGNWNVLVVRQPDGLVVIECPQSGGYSDRVIALLASRFPGMPIKAVVSTTDSLWHIAGARPYVALGAPIYVLDRNAARLARFIARPRTIVPDRLSTTRRQPELRPVGERTVIGEGASRIELYPIRGHGDARMMMAFMPALGLLYGSSNDQGGPGTPTTFNAFELVARVAALHLPVTDYVAIHTEKVPWTQFKADVARNVTITAD